MHTNPTTSEFSHKTVQLTGIHSLLQTFAFTTHTLCQGHVLLGCLYWQRRTAATRAEWSHSELQKHQQVSCTPVLQPIPARDRPEMTVLCSPGADSSESETFTLRCSVPSSHQHAAIPSQHLCCNIAWEKSNPTVSLLPLGILPLGGQRGCLPSLPGHCTLSEPNARKVLISPTAYGRREVTAYRQLHPRIASAPCLPHEL